MSDGHGKKRIATSTILLYLGTIGAVVMAVRLNRGEYVPLLLLGGAILGSYLPMNLPSLKHNNTFLSIVDGVVVSVVILVPYVGLLYALRHLGLFTFRATLPPGLWKIIAAQLIITALPEELFFRATIQAGLNNVFTPKWKLLGIEFGWGLFVASLLFGIAHVSYQGAFGLTTAIPALAFGLLYDRRQSVAGPAIFHAACNLVMVCFPAFSHETFS